MAVAAAALSGCGGSATTGCVAVDPAKPAMHLSSYCLVEVANGVVVPTASAEPSVIPYDINTPLFSDYAIKSRMIYFPPDSGTASYDPVEEFALPNGAIVIKTFSFAPDERQPTVDVAPVETRLLVKDATGWHPLDYIWDAAFKDAVYSPAGETKSVTFLDTSGATRTASYLVPNQSQCTECHSATGEVGLLGIKARQLNRNFAYADGTQNQLTHWMARGVLTGVPAPTPQATPGPSPAGSIDGLPVLAVWNDPASGSLDDRGRAYLESNCAHCHNPTGVARTSGLFLSASVTDPAARGICKAPIAAGEGTGGNQFDIVPGSPDTSIVIYRVTSVEPGIEMPQIGRSIVHTEGVQLLSDYINSLPGTCP